MDKRSQIHFGYILAAIAAVLFIQSLINAGAGWRMVPFSEFQQALQAHRFSEVSVSPTQLRGELKDAEQGTHMLVTNRVDAATAQWLDASGVRYFAVQDSTWLRDLLSWLIPGVVFFVLWMFVIRKIAEKQGMGAGGLMAIGKSKAKVYMETDVKVTFADVAGVDEAKAELQEIVNFLKAPQQYGRLGARLPKGILLVGPPGTGKTLLARAVAGEAGVPFFSINGSEFVEMFVGVGAARVRDLFEHAREQSPAIIFIDELDALGRARAADPAFGGHDEKEQTLNQLLSELDGFDPSSGLVLLAATNRPEILDPALLRAGRFDRQVLVDRPDKPGRAQILKVHLRKIQVAGNFDVPQVAALTPGFSGADLANLVNEAALLATRRGAEQVTLEDFTQAIERIIAGLEKKNRLLNPHERTNAARNDRDLLHRIGRAQSLKKKWRCCSVAARPNRSFSVKSRLALPTISPKRLTSPAAWSCVTAWPSLWGRSLMRMSRTVFSVRPAV